MASAGSPFRGPRSAVGAGGAVSAGADGAAGAAAGAQHEAAGAQHDSADAQHDDLQQLFRNRQRASAVLEQRTRPAEHMRAAAANFVMISTPGDTWRSAQAPKRLA